MKALLGTSWVLLLANLAIAGLNAQSVTVDLTPSKDNSIYEGTAWENNSSGEGPHIYSGAISQMRARRALLAFDLSSIPAGSTISSATLTIRVSRAQGSAVPFSLFRMTSDWGEGTSATGNIGGQGVAATTNDATWLCSFFGSGGCQTSWTTDGGDFVGTPSTSLTMTGNGLFTFPSSPQLVADIQGWLDGNLDNFGWIMRNEENVQRNARRINSRENNIDPPTLTVTYTTALPVELVDFTGEKQSDKHLLSWETAAEVGFSHFDLEVSTDRGRSFNHLSRIAGRGDASQGSRYTFQAPAPMLSSSIYRLRMVDLDGSEEFSRFVELQGIQEEDEFSIWPNPVTDRLFFQTSAGGDIASLAVLNQQGQIVKEIRVDDNQSFISLPDLPSGLYLLEVQGEDQARYIRFVKN